MLYVRAVKQCHLFTFQLWKNGQFSDSKNSWKYKLVYRPDFEKHDLDLYPVNLIVLKLCKYEEKRNLFEKRLFFLHMRFDGFEFMLARNPDNLFIFYLSQKKEKTLIPLW